MGKQYVNIAHRHPARISDEVKEKMLTLKDKLIRKKLIEKGVVNG